MNIRLRYFARLREAFACEEERLELPAAATLADLLDTLRARGGVWAQELAQGRSYRLALNQEVAVESAALADADEVAIFPPVTGG